MPSVRFEEVPVKDLISRISPGGKTPSFLSALRSNRKATLLLVSLAAVLVGLEAVGYLRDVERPSSVEWLFKPKS